MSHHNSWKRYEPKGEGIKEIDSYYSRVSKSSKGNIPKEVLHQWILPHYNEPNSVKNYSWIDLDQVSFEMIELTLSEIKSIEVIEVNESMVKEYPVNQFAVWHRSFWKNNGTWEVPPILIDSQSFLDDKPETSEIEGQCQLIEGHNRLGTLLLLERDGVIDVLDSHKFFLMTRNAD